MQHIVFIVLAHNRPVNVSMLLYLPLRWNLLKYRLGEHLRMTILSSLPYRVGYNPN